MKIHYTWPGPGYCWRSSPGQVLVQAPPGPGGEQEGGGKTAMKLILTDYTNHIKAAVKATTEPPRSNGECGCQKRTSILDPPKIPPGATKEELKQLLLHLIM